MTKTYVDLSDNRRIFKLWPSGQGEFDESIPARAITFLAEAQNTHEGPNSSLMACASALDVMLQAKGLREGTLNERIDEASRLHIVTPEMAQWAHQIRLDANDIRHITDEKDLATPEIAEQIFEFAMALAEFLFVLPARVTRGRRAANNAQGNEESGNDK